jgi:hypothetical protein
MKKLSCLAFLLLAGCQMEMISEGDRIGQLTKFSHKMLCADHWSWEGELAMPAGTLAGGQGQQGDGSQTAVGAWAFSVSDKQTADDVHELLGRNVRLHYLQYRNYNNCEMGSEYKVTEVHRLDAQ